MVALEAIMFMGKSVSREKLSHCMALLSQWLAPIVIIASWSFAAVLQHRGFDYAWVVFIQAAIASLILVPCWIIARAQVKAYHINKQNS